MNEVVAELIVCTAVCLLTVECFFDLKVNLTSLHKVKKLEERVTALEVGRESDVNN